VSPRVTSYSEKDFKVSFLDSIVDLFEVINEGVYLGYLDGGSDKTIVANPCLRLILGCPAENPVDTIRPFEPKRFVDPQSRVAFIEQLHRDGSVTDYLLRLRRSDDSLFWVEVTAHLHNHQSASGRRLDALIRDVSERRRMEDQGRDVYHQTLQSEKLAALGQTVSGVAHELNNPLATILTWAERLTASSLENKTKQGIEIIKSESERAAKIVRNLLTFARKRHTTRTMVNLNEIVRETLTLRAYEHRVTNITVLDAFAEGLPPVFADPHQLKQVLLNLIINAEHAMLAAHGRGTLILRTWHNAEKDLVVLEVNDDGVGVTDEVQTKIFDPFFTTKAVGTGTGLGLTVAYAIMQEHGGQIKVKSEDGQGCSFLLDFPAGSEPRWRRKTPEKKSASLAPTPFKTAVILVVEDEIALATAVVETLADAGFTVDRSANGEEALTLIENKIYDLVICDLKMPKMDGRAFYESLAKTQPNLANNCLFVTGDVAAAETETFLQETGCRWLAKPFRLRDLLQVTHDLLS